MLGVDSRRLGERERAQTGYVSENLKLPEWMTVRQLLDYCRGFHPAWDPGLEASLRARFALPADRPLKQLSRGMRMKAALLAVLAYRPRLLLLDEPFSGLDPVVRDDVVAGLLEAAQLGETTVLVSSNDIEEVERLCDHVAILDEGRLQLAERTDDLLARFRRVEVALSGPPVAAGLPAGWLGWRSAGDRVSFVDSRYRRESTEQAWRERFPEASVAAHPMTLREVVITLARPGRTPGENTR